MGNISAITRRGNIVFSCDIQTCTREDVCFTYTLYGQWSSGPAITRRRSFGGQYTSSVFVDTEEEQCYGCRIALAALNNNSSSELGSFHIVKCRTFRSISSSRLLIPSTTIFAKYFFQHAFLRHQLSDDPSTKCIDCQHPLPCVENIN